MQYIIGIVVIMLYSGITFYIGRNVQIWLSTISIQIPQLLFWPVLYFIAFSFLLARAHSTLKPLSVIGNYWMFVFQYGLLLCIVANIVVYVTPLSSKVVGSGAIILFIILFIVGTYNAYSPVVREITLKADVSEPLTIVVASDFHLGLLSHKNHLKKFVDLSNAQEPDAVLLVGDLVDDDPLWFVSKGMGEVMAQLQTTYGVYGVVGNHEYYGKKIPLLVHEMEQANVKILLDETIVVGERFYLTGREDKTNGNRLPLEELAPENSDLPWFVMNHTPDDIQTPANLGVNFHVSGHTHLGQLWPNNFITDKVFELDYGYKNKEGMHALVSSGFGFWGPPMRIGSRSELWVVKMEPAQ